jgi:hypothetical protein
MNPERISMKLFIAFISALWMLASDTRAQSYSIDWFTLDGGGGTSTGSVYSVSGTIGQPDASGTSSGGNYSLTGGFWSSLAAIQTSGSPLLTIKLAGSNTVIISWPAPAAGFVLQQTSALDTPSWVNVTNAVAVTNGINQVSLSFTSGNQFYQLIRP